MSTNPDTGKHIYPLNDPETARRIGCQLKTPMWILGVGLSMVRQYFSTSDRVSVGTNRFLYDEKNPKKSQLYIDIEDNFESSIAGKGPAIIVSLAGQQFQPHSINMNMHSVNAQGDANYLALNNTGLIYTCLGMSSVISIDLSSEMKYFFITYAPILTKEYGLNNLAITAISPTKKMQAASVSQFYGTQVAVNFMVQETWTTAQEELRVKQISFTPDVSK